MLGVLNQTIFYILFYISYFHYIFNKNFDKWNTSNDIKILNLKYDS